MHLLYPRQYPLPFFWLNGKVIAIEFNRKGGVLWDSTVNVILCIMAGKELNF